MPLDTASRIGDLNSSIPADGNFVFEGDDHIRAIKNAAINSFPALTLAGVGAGIVKANADDLPLGKKNATMAPTTTDDSVAGYAVGSIWVDITNDRIYICVNAGASAAIWIELGNDQNEITGIIFPSGAEIVYAGPSTPSGWTVQASSNQHGIRLNTAVPAAGVRAGSVNFTTAFKNQTVTGSVTSNGAHTHANVGKITGTPSSLLTTAALTGLGKSASETHTHTVPATSSDGAHTHPFSGTSINLTVKYQDMAVIRKT